jgi:hypothetical protein
MKLTGAETIVKCLEEQGVEDVRIPWWSDNRFI